METFIILTALLGCGGTIAGAPSVRIEKQIPLDGDLAYADELSGVAFWRDLMIACPDEGGEFNLLNAATGKLVSKVSLLDDEDEEIDMEGAASDADYVYVIGSHSIRRKQVDDEGSTKKNRKRLAKVKPHEESYSLFRLTLDDRGELQTSERSSLADILEANEILRPYTKIPGKENGIDVEGIAVKEGMLNVGFRGPVLRGNFVPVLRFAFERPEEYQLKFVQLDGRGIRDITAVDDGFLILAGPVGDGDFSYKLYLWNGEDCIPGDAGVSGQVAEVGELATTGDSKPEGIALLAEEAGQWRLMLLCDGDSRARELVVAKP